MSEAMQVSALGGCQLMRLVLIRASCEEYS
jgi:hypothetical protein